MKKIDEDYEAWARFPHHRWIFNKLELSMKLGYNCGPACVPVNRNGMYVVRPIYNLYGMGVGAFKKWLRHEDKEAITRHGFIPPGYFWCEFFEGEHYSVDYEWRDEGKGGIHSHWAPICTTVGKIDDNLQHFAHWEKIKNIPHFLPDFVDPLQDALEMNIEWKGSNIIEVHLRSGNDIVHDDPIGTEMIPHWLSDDPKYIQNMIDDGWEYHKNYDDGEVYDACGHIEDPRVGYLKRCKL